MSRLSSIVGPFQRFTRTKCAAKALSVTWQSAGRNVGSLAMASRHGGAATRMNANIFAQRQMSSNHQDMAEKETTGIVGIKVDDKPREHLLSLCRDILDELSRLPPDYHYGKTTGAAIAGLQAALLDAKHEGDIEEAAARMGVGRCQAEELIEQLEDELCLARTMNSAAPTTNGSGNASNEDQQSPALNGGWKAWEPLQEEPPRRVWSNE